MLSARPLAIPRICWRLARPGHWLFPGRDATRPLEPTTPRAACRSARAAAGLDRVTVAHRPGLPSDSGASCIPADLAAWLYGKGMRHIRGAPRHPRTRGKIERWHQILKNRVLLENYDLPEDLERQVAAFFGHCNQARYHESSGNLTPTDVCFGRGQVILSEPYGIKRQTITQRRSQHHPRAA